MGADLFSLFICLFWKVAGEIVGGDWMLHARDREDTWKNQLQTDNCSNFLMSLTENSVAWCVFYSIGFMEGSCL